MARLIQEKHGLLNRKGIGRGREQPARFESREHGREREGGCGGESPAREQRSPGGSGSNAMVDAWEEIVRDRDGRQVRGEKIFQGQARIFRLHARLSKRLRRRFPAGISRFFLRRR